MSYTVEQGNLTSGGVPGLSSIGAKEIPTRTRSSASDGRTSASGHSISSLTMALEQENTRKSFVTDESIQAYYSSDEENLAAAKADQDNLSSNRGDNETGDDSISSSLKEFMSSAAADGGEISSSFNSNSYASQNASHIVDTFEKTKLLIPPIDTSTSGLAPSATQSPNTPPGQGIEQEGSTSNAEPEQEKAWQFLTRDLLNILLDYVDSTDRNIVAGLTAETLSLAANNAPKPSPIVQTFNATTNTNDFNLHTPERLSNFKLLAMEDDGEIMDDLPEFGLDTDVLGMGIDHFCVMNKKTLEQVLHVKLQERVASSMDRKKITPIAAVSGGPGPAGVSTPPIVISCTTTPTSQDNTGRSFHDKTIVDVSTAEYSHRTVRASSETDAKIHASSANRIRKKGKKMRLIVLVKFPTKEIWNAITKVRIHDPSSSNGRETGDAREVYARYDDDNHHHSDAAATNAALNATLTKGAFKGTSNAAEVSALRALMCSTVGELEPTVEPMGSGLHLPTTNNELQGNNRRSVEAEMGILSPGDSSTGSATITWRRVTSYGSGDSITTANPDDDSISITPSETTIHSDIDNDNDNLTLGMSKEGEAMESYVDGGYNDDLGGEDLMEMSMEEGVPNMTSSSGNNNNSNQLKENTESRPKSTSIFGRIFGGSTGRERKLSNPNAPEGGLFDLEIDTA